jgi:hypothetical protein
MIDFTIPFADLGMGFWRQAFLVGVPEITETAALAIGFRHSVPELATGVSTAVANGKGRNLARATAHDCPDPAFVLAKADK